MLLKLERKTNLPHRKMACVDSDVLNDTETPAQFLYNDINDQASSS
jgi:hypothetical protein